MPPVFGPVSPSPARLWSRAAASGIARLPSVSAKTESSGPSSSSSISTWSSSADALRSPASTSSCVVQTKTPFPAASPSALITHGGRAIASWAAIGTRAAESTSLAKLFEPSMRAAAALGPNVAMPASRNSSATPATSGPSGPITARSIPSARASSSRPSLSSARTGWHVPSAAMPGLPGAA